MKKQIAFIALLISMGSGPLLAQNTESKPWSLKECIDYATEHNIDIKRAGNETDQQAVAVNTAKWSRLPNLNGGVNQNWSWGRTTSPEDNSYSNINRAATDFSLSTSIPLFTGMRLSNEYAQSKLNLKASMEELNKAKEDVAINVASAYLQVLLDSELHDIALRQTAISKEQLARLKSLFDLGKASTAQVVEAEARVAQDEMAVVKSQNTYQLALLALSQLLELPSPEGLQLITPATDIPFTPLTPIHSIFTQAINNKPVVRAAEYRLESSQRSIRIAQSQYYPTLDFSAGLGTNYYTVNGKAVAGFGKQLDNNLNKFIGLRLNIPIFNRFSTRNNVRKARMEQIAQTLQLDNIKKGLYKEIQQAWYNAKNAESQYNSSLVTVEANEKSFELITEKFANGKATSLEYTEAKFNLAKAQSERIQAKYNYLFSTKIINFYQGIPIE